MAYGHREKGNCADIELIVPPAAGTANAISTAANTLKFLGKTPLSEAVKQAAEALKYTEDKATVILITDGLETCNADPCALARNSSGGRRLHRHVVGFGLTSAEGRQVACLADNTGGKYIQADDEGAGGGAGRDRRRPDARTRAGTCPGAGAEAPEFNSPDRRAGRGRRPDQGRQRLGDLQGQAPTARAATTSPPSTTSTRPISSRATTSWSPKWREAGPSNWSRSKRGRSTSRYFVLNAGRLVIHPRPSEGADIDAAARAVVIDYPGAVAHRRPMATPGSSFRPATRR